MIISFTYNQSLNSEDSLTIEFTAAGNTSVTELPANTDNNLAFKYYDSNIYSTSRALSSIVEVVSYIALAIFFIGLGASRLVPIEMIFTFQFTHCALATLRKLETLMEPLKYLYITQGPNLFLSDSTNSLPPRLSAIYFSDTFVNNFNLQALFLLVPAIWEPFSACWGGYVTPEGWPGGVT